VVESLGQAVHTVIPIRNSGRTLAQPQYATAAGLD
jgi:hypothetical protein